MKKIILICMLLFPIVIGAQTIPLALRMDLVTKIQLENKNYLAGDRVGTLTVQVYNYDVFQTTSGQYYINYVDARLVTRRKYLGYAFGTHTYEGNTVFFNADTTKAWIWTTDRYGTPTFKMELPDYFSDWARINKNTTP